mmetsp:Transcript_19482/g.28780  ORF Transcript_19482/g.28780 Transcript_19482/m.28780 type:complete len:195 (-) Transcript_19482:226-810(-)
MISKSTIASMSALLLSTLLPSTNGFSILRQTNTNALTLKNPSILTHGTALYSSSTPKQFESVVSKYYNLEEKEDNENSTTEIFLLADGTVSLGETDAPLTVKATGTWSQNGGEFEMHIKRTFGAGQDHTDVGEFQFVVERGFVGQLETVGALLSVGGSMHLKDEKGDVEVGFFNMIDTTAAKLGEEDEEFSADP